VKNVWAFIHKLGSPKWCYDFMGLLLPWVTIITVIFLTVGVVWGLVFAPEDYQQGNSFRIIYIHVPSAILAQSCYALMALAAAVGLIWKIKIAHMVTKVAAPIGASFTLMALATGAIWGKPTWGTWWEWDARLTSMLILFFLYAGVIALHSSIREEVASAKAGAILTLVGVVNLPIIKFSVNWWNTLHQPATFTLTEKPAMPPEMWLPLLMMVVGFYVFFALVLMMRLRVELLSRERKTQWVKEVKI
jgi:heme exporter protein C